MAKRDENDITISHPGKRIRKINPKREEAIEAQKERHGREVVKRYMKLFYSDMLTLHEVAKLLDVSWPVAQEILRSSYFENAEPNRDEERKDMEFRYADLYHKYHRE